MRKSLISLLTTALILGSACQKPKEDYIKVKDSRSAVIEQPVTIESTESFLRPTLTDPKPVFRHQNSNKNSLNVYLNSLNEKDRKLELQHLNRETVIKDNLSYLSSTPTNLFNITDDFNGEGLIMSSRDMRFSHDKDKGHQLLQDGHGDYVSIRQGYIEVGHIDQNPNKDARIMLIANKETLRIESGNSITEYNVDRDSDNTGKHVIMKRVYATSLDGKTNLVLERPSLPNESTPFYIFLINPLIAKFPNEFRVK